MAATRADDIGEEHPGADPVVINKIDNHQEHNYSTGAKDISVKLAQTDDPEASLGSTVAATGLSQRGRVKQENNDTLIVAILDDNDVEGKLELVAKVFRIRRGPFDGKTIDGVSYDYTDIDKRTSTLVGSDPLVEALEEVTPGFVIDFDEITFVEMDNGTGIEGVKFQDITPGRQFAKVGVPE